MKNSDVLRFSAQGRVLARRFALCPLILFLALVGACVAPSVEPTQPPATATTLQIETATLASPPEGAAGPFWWNDAVFYEIFVRSFHDSDGDGIGDLNGIIEKLDYLNDGDPATTDDLGITGIWLMPITQSPSYHGCDVVDYFTVDDEYGTDEDSRRLTEEAHKRDIRVIVDLVLNQFATFLTNHDQKRAMSELGEDVNPAKMAASLLLTGPGVPFLYYGEEIGHVGGKPDENIRTPMQWSGEDNAGFTAAPTAWRAPQSNCREVNVAAQTDDPDSLLSHYRRLIHARNDHAALRVGGWREVEVEDRRIYAFLRHSDDETLLVLINLGSEPITDCTLSLAEGPLSEGSASEIFTGVPVSAPTVNADGGFDGYAPLAEVEAYSTYIIQLE